MVYTYLITGANKGIGLAIVEELVKKDDVKVIATARTPSKAAELKKLADDTKKVEIIELDVSSKASIEKLGAQLESIAPEGIDFLIANAGVASALGRSIDFAQEAYLEALNVNLFGSLYVFKEVYPFLLKKDTRKVAFTSSGSGSLSLFVPMPDAPYGISKVALNYLTKSLALDHKSENFTFVAIHPGVVTTDMNPEPGNNPNIAKYFTPELIALFSGVERLTPHQSATLLVKVYDSITFADSGKFLNYDGADYPL